MNSLTVCVRQWFESRNGNSYITMRVVVDGIDTVTTPMYYGHGDEQALSFAMRALEQVDYPLPTKLVGLRQSVYRTLKLNGVNVVVDYTYVSRRMDLHRGGRLQTAESTLLWLNPSFT